MIHQGYLLIHQNIIWQPLSRPSSQKANDANNTNYFVNRTRIQPTQIEVQPDASAEPSENKGPESLLTIKPNPASTFVEITYNRTQTKQNQFVLEVFNIYGNHIQTSTFDFNGTSIIENLNWKPGLYLIIVKDNQKIISYHKLVIE
jgi:hypothetical protein